MVTGQQCIDTQSTAASVVEGQSFSFAPTRLVGTSLPVESVTLVSICVAGSYVLSSVSYLSFLNPQLPSIEQCSVTTQVVQPLDIEDDLRLPTQCTDSEGWTGVVGVCSAQVSCTLLSL